MGITSMILRKAEKKIINLFRAKCIKPANTAPVEKPLLDFTSKVSSNPFGFTKSAPQLVNFESLKLKDNLVNVPKLNALDIKEEALCLVHMSDFAPEGGKILSIREALGASRNSVHFSLNHPVKEHYLGSWNNCKYAFVMPYKSTKEANAAGKFIEGLPNDLYTNGSVKIPQGSVIIKYNKDVDSGKVLVSNYKDIPGVKLIETSENAHSMVSKVIEKMGYSHTSINVAGTFGKDLGKNTPIEILTKECQAWKDFCNAQGIKPMRHGYSPNGTAEQIIESLDMLATTNKWKNGSWNMDYKKIMLEGIKSIKQRVHKDGYFISMDLDKLENIISKSYTPRLALYRVKKQLNIEPAIHRKRKIFSNYNDYKTNLDLMPINPDKYKEYYNFYSSNTLDKNSQYIKDCIKFAGL